MRKPLQSKYRSFVIKSNALIEARYRLSLQESHVILWLLTQIRHDDEDFKPHKLDIIDFAKMLQVKSGNQYKELRKITKHLMQRIIEIYEPEAQEFIQVAWLSSARYQKKKGCVLLRFDPGLKPYLLQLKNYFTKIDIVDTLKLKSIYSIRIFELLLQYISLGVRNTTLSDLRGYCGIEDNEYELYAHLKSRIIERAKTEINSKTEYEVDYAEIKESRKVVSLEWTIKKKNLFIDDKLEKEYRSEASLSDALFEYGFSKSIAKRLLQNHEEDVIKNALRAVNIQVERNHVKNPKAMLQTAIKEKWHPEVFKKKSS